jgi:hypothetical protein
MMTLKHFYLVLVNDALGRGRWDLLWEDLVDLLKGGE